MTVTKNASDLRAYGFSLIVSALVLNSLVLSLHVAGAAASAMHVASGLASFAAIALFYKASDARRRPVLIATVAAIALAGVVIALVILRR